MSGHRTWVISDTHFCHRNIIKYCNRPFETVEQMNLYLIEQWNKTVSESDEVLCLGDFCLAGARRVEQIGQQLKGRKILILGNHDGASMDTYHYADFRKISSYPIYKDGILFSHYPIADTPVPNVHGHIHDKNLREIRGVNKPMKMYFNASVDVLPNWRPINLEEIKAHFQNLNLL